MQDLVNFTWDSKKEFERNRLYIPHLLTFWHFYTFSFTIQLPCSKYLFCAKEPEKRFLLELFLYFLNEMENSG